MHRLLGFDLDGTLIDSAPDLHAALGVALESIGLRQPTEAQTRSWVGDGIDALIERGLEWAAGELPAPEATVRVHAAFDAHYSAHCFDRSRVYPDVVPTLESLRAEGCVIACITNKRRSFAEPMLAAADLEACLDLVLAGDSCPRRKPHPDQLIEAAIRLGQGSDRAVLIGDSPNDMDAAAAAGWRFVFAAYGYTGAMHARGASPPLRIDRFGDLPERLGH